MEHPSLYEINTRVWLREFGPDARLLTVPDQYWEALARTGISHVWLMGVWRTRPDRVVHYALEEGLQQAYTRALPDWTTTDLIGSPYAIDRYELDPQLGQTADLAVLRQRLHGLGLRLILDFVPNHFHAESSLVAEYPDAFVQAHPEWQQRDAHTFYRLADLPDYTFAHGKDPNFAAWQDTIQVNYFHAAGRSLMQDQLVRLADYCDGVRCDMAMLPLNAVFARTWGHLFEGVPTPHGEFWPRATAAVRAQHPEFLFIAEVYWDMEWELQQQGFDYTYDKELLDRLLSGESGRVRDHLRADSEYQRRSVRFLENHDEDRILHQLDSRRAQATALVAYTVPGLRFFFDGQWEGRRVRLPVQLGRLPRELKCSCPVNTALAHYAIQQLPQFMPVCGCQAAFYERLLALLRQPALREGEWTLLELPNSPQWLAWQWSYAAETWVIAINYGARPAPLHLPLAAGEWREFFTGAGVTAAIAQHTSIEGYPWQYLVLFQE